MSGRCYAWAYSFLEEAAEQGRIASRRYWAKDGPADKKHPQQPMPWSPETAPTVAIEDYVERRRRRQKR